MTSTAAPDPSSRSPSPPPEEDVAAAMGFASFGSKPNPPKKKRKLAGVDMSNEGSGSNNTPLGVRTKGPIRVEKGNQSQDQEYSKTQSHQDYAVGSHDNVGGHVSEAKCQVNGSPGYGVDGYASHPADEDDEGKGSLHAQGLNSTGGPSTTSIHNIPIMSPYVQHTGGKDSNGNWDWQALRRGVIDENGDTAYYDESFVEDPWRHLRKRT